MGLLVLVVLAGVGEVAIRLTHGVGDLQMNPSGNFFLVDHPTLLWSQRPNFQAEMPEGWSLRTNSLGLRNPELPAKQGRRVLSLGESTTWGHGVEEHKTYNQVIASRLDVEVINAGVPGYSIWQSYLYLRDYGLQLDSDVVIIYHQANDFLPTHVIDENSYLYQVSGSDRELTERREPFVSLLTPLFGSHLYRFLRKQTLIGRAWVAWATGGGEPQQTQVRVPDPDRRLALEGMRALCEEQEIELVVVQPFYEHGFDEELLQEFAAEHELPYIDARLARSKAKGHALFQDGIHPTAKGHQVIGEVVADGLGKLWSPRPTGEYQPSSTRSPSGAVNSRPGTPP